MSGEKNDESFTRILLILALGDNLYRFLCRRNYYIELK